MPKESVVLDNGKYEVVVESAPGHHRFHALRYGEPWRDLTGDGMIMAMLYRIQELEEKVKTLGGG